MQTSLGSRHASQDRYGSLARVIAGVLALKAYTWVILFVFARQTGVR